MICLGCATFECRGVAVATVADAYRRRVLGRSPAARHYLDLYGRRDDSALPWTACAAAELAMIGQPPPDESWAGHVRALFEIPDVRPLDPSDPVSPLLAEARALLAGYGGVVADTVDRFQDGVWWGGHGLRSSTHPLLPRLALVGANATRLGGRETPVAVAEALVHEALHAKLIDVLLVRPVFRAVGADVGFVPSWGDRWGEDRWHVMRVLAAAHVYVHLAAFHEVIGDDEARTADCRARAFELLTFLSSAEARASTRPSGAAFLDALTAAAHEGAALACDGCADIGPPTIEVTADAVGCPEVGSQLVARHGTFLLELSA